MNILSTYLPPLLAFILCLVLTPTVRFCAIRMGWMAQPSEERWHKKTTAFMGGIAIYIGISLPLWLVADFTSVWNKILAPNQTTHLPSIGATIWLGATFLFVLGLVDDFKNIKPTTKLIGQILAATLVAFLGFRLNWFTSLTLDTMVTLVWIIGITNAFNLLDNMDGLCAGVGLITALSLTALFFGSSLGAMQIALILACSFGAFLVYNFNPASIFMGDCGSLIIGFSLSVLCLHLGDTGFSNRLAALAVPVLLLMVPILDTSLVTIIRILSGRKASTGGRDHTSHRLVQMGFSEKIAVLFLYGVCAMAGLAAVFVSRNDTLTSPMVIIPVGLAILLMGIYLSQLRVYPEKEFSVLRDHSFGRVLADVTYKKQMILMLLDMTIIAFAYYMAYRLRFSNIEFVAYFPVFLKSFPAIIGCKLMIFYILGIYKGFWIYISVGDVLTYVRASIIATLLAVVTVTFAYRFKNFSKGIFLIDWILTTGLLLSVRWSFRLFVETHKRKTLSGENVLIYGAGRGGELLMREIINNGDLNVKPVGFIDDDTMKHGKKIQGYAILGALSAMRDIHAEHNLKGIILSFSDSQQQHKQAHETVKKFCRQHHLWLKQFKIDLIDIHSVESDQQ